MHDIVVVGIPLFAILAGILFNRSDVKDLRADMIARFNKVDQQFNKVDQQFNKVDEQFNRIESRFNKIDERFNRVDDRFNRVDDRFDRVDADLRQFHFITGKLEGRVESIEKRS